MIVTADCPHCGTRKVAFNVRFEFQARQTPHEKLVLATCNACRYGVIFELHLVDHTASSKLTDLIGDQYSLRMAVTRQWPPDADAVTPPDVPQSVQRYFDQAVANLRAKHFDAAGVMFRKALEVATREKAPSAAGKPLIKRIDALATQGLITADMSDWAHQIRLGGNEAAHDDDPIDENAADRLFRFTDAFLRYAYTLPAMVSANKIDSQD